MENGFSYGDIIVIGAIAVFILLRYRAMLGERSERDQDGPITPPQPENYERVIQLPATRVEPKKEDLTNYGSLADQLVAMRAIDRDFAPDEFLNGARIAYEMVITAFSKGDRDTLKMLLSDPIYKQFETSLKEAETSGQRPETTLIAIKQANLADAKLKGNTATITVDFLSEQVHVLRDGEGTIIEGDPSREEQVEDRWVFTRNLASSDPSWKVIDT